MFQAHSEQMEILREMMKLVDQAHWLLILPIRMGTTVTVRMLHRGEKHSGKRHFLEPLVDINRMVRNSQYDDVV